jgi:endoglucanase
MKFKLILISILNLFVSAKWTTNENSIQYNNENVMIRGINWYGLETYNMVMEGLWYYPIDYYLDILSNHSFNAIRVPFSEDVMFFHNNTIPQQNLVAGDPEIYNKTSLEILETLFDKAKERGIGILLDCHRTSMANPSALWYLPNNTYFTEENFFKNWVQVIQKFISYPNFIGIEVYNEPHNNATMGDFNPQTDVMIMYQNLLDTIEINFGIDIPFLVFVDGINWGKDYRGITDFNPLLYHQLVNQIVYSPHIYGPTLTPLDFYTLEYITALYNTYFGFLFNKWNKTICTTEWGLNTNNKLDLKWADLYIQYLENNNARDNFFWALNPEGKDIKGLLNNNWTHVSNYKYNLIKRLTPEPTKFLFLEEGQPF